MIKYKGVDPSNIEEIKRRNLLRASKAMRSRAANARERRDNNNNAMKQLNSTLYDEYVKWQTKYGLPNYRSNPDHISINKERLKDLEFKEKRYNELIQTHHTNCYYAAELKLIKTAINLIPLGDLDNRQ